MTTHHRPRTALERRPLIFAKAKKDHCCRRTPKSHAVEIDVSTNRAIKWLANVVLRTEPLIVKLAPTFFTKNSVDILVAILLSYTQGVVREKRNGLRSKNLISQFSGHN
jgi:hypothetical protein